MFLYLFSRVLSILLIIWTPENCRIVDNIFGTLHSTFNEQQEKTLSLLSTLYSTVYSVYRKWRLPYIFRHKLHFLHSFFSSNKARKVKKITSKFLLKVKKSYLLVWKALCEFQTTSDPESPHQESRSVEECWDSQQSGYPLPEVVCTVSLYFIHIWAFILLSTLVI